MILVTLKLSQNQKDRLRNALEMKDFVFVNRKDLKKEHLKNAEIIIGNIPIEMLRECQNLKWIQLSNAGADDIVRCKECRKEIIITNAKGAYGKVISEHMLAMLFMLQKHMDKYLLHQQKQEWISEMPPSLVEGKTMVIMGTGDIGGTFAKKVKALGSYTIGVKRNPVDFLDNFDEIVTLSDLDSVIPRADILVMALPQTKYTSALMNAERIERLKKTAIIINVGRGLAIDTDALIIALKEKRIAGAALDVTEPEPLPRGHALWEMENVIITPHISGNADVPETLEKILEIAENNLKRYYSGEELINIVDRSVGY